ncbi:maleylpyruvate isomerase family mycothiol-dependent enzyme [Actinomadura sp. KC345]|uniref:maleylpyruvate isomerase family mycothiol-dependent enzyme n=1 Tax=Actinomadura sp. KC345 TaxID=2530371 RepID=UPI001049D5E4|nr:maleylpyruvate isomerase family mycothiol-dependent enzyme [Actinomadura sp. KC345]TDC50795.1 maleylpyruvate isomerase family mycothiol-dependent enzyme [Actinomadura sp. KC345]
MEATPAHLTSETRAERERLAGLLGDLAPESWDAPSLCDGWRVREVVAHVTMPFRTRPIGVMAGLARAGFSFNRYADRDARSAAHALSEAELLDLLRRNIDHPWRPPGGGQAGALSHDVIHGLDITEPLGLPSPPAERLALVLASNTARQLKYFGVDLGGRKLTATDSDAVVGEGPAVAMTSKEILLVVTGRRPLDQSRGTDR